MVSPFCRLRKNGRVHVSVYFVKKNVYNVAPVKSDYFISLPKIYNKVLKS